MPITKITKKDIFPISIVIVLLFISTACAMMLIPSYVVIGEEFGFTKEFFAIPDAFFLLISAAFALLWGYYADKVDRIKVLLAGAFSWTLGMLFTYFSNSYEMLLLSRAISGAGLGCVLPIGYSVISDAIPPDERSGWFGLIAILSAVSNATGQALSAFLGPITSWRFPFLLLSIISLIVIVILFFVKMPQSGASEGELLELSELNLEYKYKISKDDLREIAKKKTNRTLFIQGFFAIVPGTVLVYFLTTLFTDYFFINIPEEIRRQTSTVFAGLIGIGYILGHLIFSYLGDVLFRKNKKNRARLATICMLLSIPLVFLMFLSLRVIDISAFSFSYPNPIPDGQTGLYIIQTIIAIFTYYPTYVICFFLALFTSILSAAPVANKNAVMVDVNLPEHKGTAASLFNLSEQIGKGLTLFLASGFIFLLGSMYNMMILSMFFWVPAGIMWILASKNVVEEMDNKSKLLAERKQITLIDHIFELEIEMDKALQKVQDSKYYIVTDEKKFFTLIDDALKIFKYCEHQGGGRSITNIGAKALGMRRRVIKIRSEVKKIYKALRKDKPKKYTKIFLKEKLKQLGEQIGVWGKSTFGELQTYYEDAYIKITEAKLLRNRDLIKSMNKINEAIVIYHRVKHILSERAENVEKSKLSKEETKIYKKEVELLEKSERTLKATIKLKEEIQNIVNQLSAKGIRRDDLIKISELTLEYQVNLYKVMEETFGEDSKTKNALKDILKNIDKIFENYDQWQEEDFKVF